MCTIAQERSIDLGLRNKIRIVSVMKGAYRKACKCRADRIDDDRWSKVARNYPLNITRKRIRGKKRRLWKESSEVATGIILSRVSVTKTRVWIGDSVYWIFTSHNYNSSYILKITVTTAHVTSHTKSSDSSSGHTAVPLELWNSSDVN
jgi:hypothetical protein